MMKDSYLSYKSVTVPAGLETVVAITGSIFSVQDATAQFLVGFDDETEYVPMESGQTLRLPGGQRFRRLTLRNASAVAVTVNFYAGSIAIVDSRLGRINAGLYLVGWDETSLAGETAETFTGVSGADVRKQITVTNLDSAVDLQILDADDNVAATVPPGTAWTMEVGGVVKVNNANGSAVSCNVCETFYDLS